LGVLLLILNFIFNAFLINLFKKRESSEKHWNHKLMNFDYVVKNRVLNLKSTIDYGFFNIFNVETSFYIVDSDEELEDYILIYSCEKRFFGLVEEENAYLLTKIFRIDFEFAKRVNNLLKINGKQLEYVDQNPGLCKILSK
jgi:hypothetical protein